jgi:hypothetical protein
MALKHIIKRDILKLRTFILSPFINAKGTKKRTRGAAANIMPISLAEYPTIDNTFGRNII